jgi:hypothetical protein
LFVLQVVGLQELRTDYKEYQERRRLRDGESVSCACVCACVCVSAWASR